MDAYKHDVVVVIKMGAYFYGVLILCGCQLSRFYGITVSIVGQHVDMLGTSFPSECIQTVFFNEATGHVRKVWLEVETIIVVALFTIVKT